MKNQIRKKILFFFFLFCLIPISKVNADASYTALNLNEQPVIYVNSNYSNNKNSVSPIAQELLYSCHSDKSGCASNPYNINGSFMGMQTIGDYKYITSAQSMAITYDASYIVVMMETNRKEASSSGGYDDHVSNSMFILKKNSNGTYSKVKIINDLQCGHANGSTYYKDKNGNDYIIVATEEEIVKFKVDLEQGIVLDTQTYLLDANMMKVSGVSYDKQEDAFYVSSYYELYKYDTSFTNLVEINGDIDEYHMYKNQDGTIYGNNFYAVGAIKSSISDKVLKQRFGFSDEQVAELSDFDASEDRVAVIEEFDKSTGTFSRFIAISQSEIESATENYYFKSPKNYSPDTENMNEIEDLEIIEGVTYLLFQKSGSFQIITPTNGVINKNKAKITLSTTSKELTYGKKGEVSYTYDGDGIVSCESSEISKVTCLVDSSNNKIVLTPKVETASNVIITVIGGEGINYSAADDKTITVSVKKKNISISYTTHVQTYGWQNYVKNGEMAGTSGEAKRLEGIKIKLGNQEYTGDVEYRTHVQTYGWQDYVKNDEMSGTSGEAKRLEAIQIRLTGEMADHYDIYYRVHAQTYGWLGWAKNDEIAGTSGLAKRLEGIEIQLVEKGGSPKENEHQNDNPAYYTIQVEYTTHVQTYGWQAYSHDGGMAGTSGEAKRLEGIRIHLSNQKYSGDIEYRTHVQTYGWQDYVKNDEMSGTSGEAKRLEAIQIRLTGEMADHYDIYYRVHAQTYGWLGWAKNDEIAGTAGLAKRLEGIEIQLVEKGKSPKENEHQNDNLPYYEN